MKRRLLIANSGGETSGNMTYRLLKVKQSFDSYQVVFVNTGLEDERTLEFVYELGKRFDVNIVWIEAVVHHGKKKSCSHRVVDFETASRNGEPFEEMIRKYGIPNKGFRHCSRELKLRPMTSYCRSIGWEAGSYHTAVGIRADEIDRINPTSAKEKIIYPLATAGITKHEVKMFWKDQPFNLRTPEHYGNCVSCWKKSDRKISTLYKERPEAFDLFERMEKTYSAPGSPERQRWANKKMAGWPGTINFWREDRSLSQLLEDAKNLTDFDPTVPPLQSSFDLSNGCDESCEIY